MFIDLRDASGVVQCVLREGTGGELRSEFCLRVVGEVSERPAGNENPDLATGEIEVAVSSYEILSTSDPLPFPLDAHAPDVSEERRLQYRYLDLRREPVARRAQAPLADHRCVARRVMDDRGFLDVETPYLTRSTPEGARDFLVPVRLQPGKLVRAAAVSAAVQAAADGGRARALLPVRPVLSRRGLPRRPPARIHPARHRDVLLRAGRRHRARRRRSSTAIWDDVLGVELTTPFPRMTYAEAMRRYGTDKPDTRFGMELVDLTGTSRAPASRSSRVPSTSAPSWCRAGRPTAGANSMAGTNGRAAGAARASRTSWSATTACRAAASRRTSASRKLAGLPGSHRGGSRRRDLLPGRAAGGDARGAGCAPARRGARPGCAS